MDFLHALLGFCEEDQEQSDDEMMPVANSDKPMRKKSLFSMPEGVNGVIIGSIFKILLTRVAEMNFLELKNLVSCLTKSDLSHQVKLILRSDHSK